MGLTQSTPCNTNTVVVNFDNCKSYDEYFKRNNGIIIEPKSHTLIIDAPSQEQEVIIVKQEGGRSRNQDSLSSLGFDDDFLKIDSDIDVNNEILRDTPQTSEIYPKRKDDIFNSEHGTESFARVKDDDEDDKHDDEDEDLENLDEDIFNDSSTEETPKKNTPKNVNSDSSTNILPKYIKKKHNN